MNLLSYLGLAVVAAFAIVLASRLYLKYQKAFLSYLANAVICSYAFAFLDIIGYFLTSEMLAGFKAAGVIHAVVNLAFRFLAFPFLVLSWYFFIRTILEILGKKLKLGFRIGYLVVQAGILVLWAALSWNSLKAPVPEFPSVAYTILLLFNVLNRALIFGLWAWAYASAPKGRDPEMASGLRRFSGAYFAVNLLYAVSALLIQDRGFVCYTYPVLEFFMHIPPLIILWDFLRRYAKSHPSEPVREHVWLMFFARHQISSREQDVTRLLLEGKNTRDIAQELFISVPTVKTHVSNIYRKLGVKNRWQLITMIQNYGQSSRQEI